MEKRFLNVFNTFTRKYERIEVTDEVYRGYMQSEWNMKDNDHSFYQHQIQFSALIGNKDEAFENFKEFMELTQDTEDEVEKKELYDALHKALKELDPEEQLLIKMLFYDRKTERECAAVFGISQKNLHKKKVLVLCKLNKLLKNFII